jgi:type II secretory pathway component GspD/PulD (secretin)
MKPWFFIAILLSCLTCGAKEKPHEGPSKHDLKLAEKSFQQALRLQKAGEIEPAFEEASKASTLAPANMEYLTTRELLRGRIAGNYIEHGNLLAEIGDGKGAEGQFKSALAVDPQNGYAQERLRDVSPEDSEHEHVLQLLASVEDVSVKPRPGRQNLHIHGDIRQLYEAIGSAFGITMAYDPSLTNQRTRFDVDNLDFYTAMRLAGKVSKTFWAPVDSHHVIVANDTQEMRRQYQRMALQTFYVGNAATPADLTDVANVLRNVFEVRLVSVVPDKNIITVRAPKELMAAIATVLDDAVKGRPEILLDIKAYEVDYDKLRQQGLGLQTNFQIFNVYAALYSALGPAAAQTIINQLQQTGTIDPSKIPVGSLSGLQNSPLLQPFIFFGKGYGLTGVSVSPISGQLSSNISSSTNLEHVVLRASSGSAATLMVGTRFPISLGSFTNVSISNQGLPQVGTAFPQIQYEDLGLTFKATPHLQTGEHVNLELQLQIKGLGAAQLNGVPVITNREYSGSITVSDGEPSVVAGIIEEQVNSTGSGYPGVGQLPVLGALASLNSKEHSRTEVLIVVTPHIIRKPFRHAEAVLWDTAQ